MSPPLWSLKRGNTPLVAAAIHNGHAVRKQVAGLLALDEMDQLRFDFLGRHLDVRENVKFRGGQFSRWIHQTFPESGCALAIEFKKFFMDEWTGEPDKTQLEAIRQALQSTVPGILETLETL